MRRAANKCFFKPFPDYVDPSAKWDMLAESDVWERSLYAPWVLIKANEVDCMTDCFEADVQRLRKCRRIPNVSGFEDRDQGIAPTVISGFFYRCERNIDD